MLYAQPKAYEPLHTCTHSGMNTKSFKSPQKLDANSLSDGHKHTSVKQAFKGFGEEGDGSTAEMMGGKQTQSWYCLGTIS